MRTTTDPLWIAGDPLPADTTTASGPVPPMTVTVRGVA